MVGSDLYGNRPDTGSLLGTGVRRGGSLLVDRQDFVTYKGNHEKSFQCLDSAKRILGGDVTYEEVNRNYRVLGRFTENVNEELTPAACAGLPLTVASRLCLTTAKHR